MDNSIRRSADAVGDDDLDALEATLGFALPADYRAVLRTHNGGVPRRNQFRFERNGQSRLGWVRWIYSVGRSGLIDPAAEDVVAEYRDRPRGLPDGVLPVASAWSDVKPGFVALACEGPSAGQVFFRPLVEPERDTLYPAAASWTAFLEGMEYEDGAPKAWKEAIADNNPERLRKWLEMKKRAWTDDRGLSLDIERAAVAENHWPTLLTLIECGFDPESLFEEALKDNRFDLARTLLGTGKVRKRAVRRCLVGGNVYLWHEPGLLDELVAAGADVNAESASGSTPLHRAVEARSAEGLRFLLERGADPTTRNDDGRTPLALANRLEEPRLAAILKEGEEAWKNRPSAAGPEVVELDLHGVVIRRAGPPLTLDEIQAFEAVLGLTFPPEYRGLLLKANGGALSPNRLPIGGAVLEEDDEDEECTEENEGWTEENEEYQEEFGRTPKVELLRLREADVMREPGRPPSWETMFGSVEEARGWYHDGSEIPRGMVPIGTLTGYGYEGCGFLLLGCKGEDRGRLFGFEHGPSPLGMTLQEMFTTLAATRDRPKSPGERLADAIEANDLDSVRGALTDGANPRKSTRDGRNALELACEAEFDDAVIAMAEAGVALDALVEPAARMGRCALVRRLIEHGEGPSTRALANALRSSPAMFSDVDLVRACVARGVNLKEKAARGRPPMYLIFAASSGSVEGLRMVLDAGHDPHYRDDQGQTLLHYAASAQTGDPEAAVRFLIGLGVKPNQATASGYTALHLAITSGNAGAARVLIDAGEDLHAKHEQYIPGLTPEESAGRAQASAQMAETLLGHLASRMADDDRLPMPDTSHPEGEKLAELIAAFGQYAERVTESIRAKQADRAAGSWGKGPSAAELARQMPHLQPLLAELEAYAASRS